MYYVCACMCTGVCVLRSQFNVDFTDEYAVNNLYDVCPRGINYDYTTTTRAYIIYIIWCTLLILINAIKI